MDDIRMIVYESLLEVEKGEISPEYAGKNMLDKYAYLDKQSRSFMHCLYEGVIDKKITLDFVIDSISKIPVKKMKKPVRCIVRMGVYQILFMNSVPDRAACNESVSLAKKKHLGNLSGFINGVLRNVSRLNKEIAYPNKQTNLKEYLSVYYSMPMVLVDSFINDYGLSKTEKILELLNEDRPVIGRTQVSRISTEELVNRLNAYENIIVRRVDGIDSFVFEKMDSLDDIEEFSEGLFTIQDISSQLVGYVAGYKEGDTVIDVCASPGGKSIHAADILTRINMDNRGHIISCDISENKLDRIEDNIRRMGVANVKTLLRDATTDSNELEAMADVVLCDAPCSGLGVIARKRDIKYGLTNEKLNELTVLQRKIVEKSVKLVKKGGTFIYSTCTMRVAENQDMVKYITDVLGLEPISFYENLPEGYKEDSAKEGYLQLFAGEKGADGFFISKFRTRA